MFGKTSLERLALARWREKETILVIEVILEFLQRYLLNSFGEKVKLLISAKITACSGQLNLSCANIIQVRKVECKTAMLFFTVSLVTVTFSLVTVDFSSVMDAFSLKLWLLSHRQRLFSLLLLCSLVSVTFF